MFIITDEHTSNPEEHQVNSRGFRDIICSFSEGGQIGDKSQNKSVRILFTVINPGFAEHLIDLLDVLFLALYACNRLGELVGKVW